jgi:hypothetical protein
MATHVWLVKIPTKVSAILRVAVAHGVPQGMQAVVETSTTLVVVVVVMLVSAAMVVTPLILPQLLKRREPGLASLLVVAADLHSLPPLCPVD